MSAENGMMETLSLRYAVTVNQVGSLADTIVEYDCQEAPSRYHYLRLLTE
jgi:hypothetical protein